MSRIALVDTQERARNHDIILSARYLTDTSSKYAIRSTSAILSI